MDQLIKPYVKRINKFLNQHLNQQKIHANYLKEALLYSALNGGKRIRAILVYFSGELFNANIHALDYAASTIELIHAYSLVHDDLPAMDDDSLRRGKPTCHIHFDEATAILAGDLMQSLAFSILTDPILREYDISAEQILLATRTISLAANDMVSGQVLDLQSENKPIDFETLQQIHTLKTAKLIIAALELGLLFSPHFNDQSYQKSLYKLGASLGLAFQIQDDILDITSTTEILGKPQGSDISHNKATYPNLLGLQQSQQLLTKTFKDAYLIADLFPQNQSLLTLIQWIEKRSF
ncbi:polyprenyl synthetase family protein [Thiotrichales bacterium 19S3-7]|nr:polyprenyl synthetase family protein [Thiotrichales bacterium 19S3-7]MCF6801587.1 polyprenyl synthetase family protein [Thiotrichales bacterium 19S3-11]